MARMVVIYRTPEDPIAFDKHYFGEHVPMAKKLPGLKKYEISKGDVITVAGDPETYLIATLYFDDLQSIRDAFASKQGQACAADRRLLVPNEEDVQMFLFEDHSV